MNKFVWKIKQISPKKIVHSIFLGENILAVAVVKAGAKSVKVFFPGNANDIWYKINDNNIWPYYKAGATLDIPVDIGSVINFVFRQLVKIIICFDI